MSTINLSFFEEQRTTLEQSIEMTIASLRSYGERYRHVGLAYSGGKDSTATVSLYVWLVATGQIPQPESITVLYADTRQELPPLHLAAMEMLRNLRERGIHTQVVLPSMDKRFMVYMFGRGVPPPNNRTLRWCTRQIKVDPMLGALASFRQQAGEKILMLTGVRLGESGARDDRIALSCSRDNSECGQGWFQISAPQSVADTLAPLLHWRVCHVWDWLSFEAPSHGFPTGLVAEVYGGEEAEELNARTGCIGCPLAEKETALEHLIAKPYWSYLAPLMKLKPLYRELRKRRNRLRKDGTERNKDGSLAANPGRMGPLTMEARVHGLTTVLSIQAEINAAAEALSRPAIDLINQEEFARIGELIGANTWPNKWDGTELPGTALINEVIAEGIVQPLLFDLESDL